ncbi:MAG: carotenoid biosynthesis protein [Ignavibacteria bacterium]
MSQNKSYLFFYIIILAGLIGHFSVQLFDTMLIITPVVLFLMGILIVWISGSLKSKKFIIWFVLMYLFTLMVEIIGVQSGRIFGEYIYGYILGLKIYGVPVIIGFNWVLVILGAVSIALKFNDDIFMICLLSSLMAVLFDTVLEPVAIKFGYWQWRGEEIPAQNYIAWLIISFIISYGLIRFKVDFNSKAFIHYYIGLLLFFFILNFK